MTLDEFLATDPFHLAVIQLNSLVDQLDPACWYHSHWVWFVALIDAELAYYAGPFLNGED